MKVPSARHRKMVRAQNSRLLVKQWSFTEDTDHDLPEDAIGVGRLEYAGADNLAEILTMVTEENVEVYRKALAIMAADLLAVYDFIDEWSDRLDRDTAYAKAQQVVLKALQARMSSPITDLLIDTIMGVPMGQRQ